MVQKAYSAQDQGSEKEKTWRIKTGSETVQTDRKRVWWVPQAKTPRGEAHPQTRFAVHL